MLELFVEARSNLNVIYIEPIQFENAFIPIRTQRTVRMPLKLLQIETGSLTPFSDSEV